MFLSPWPPVEQLSIKGEKQQIPAVPAIGESASRIGDRMAAMTDGPQDCVAADSMAGEGPSPAVRALADELVPLFYEELRTLAHRIRGKAGGGATLQTTALVHETYFKLRSARGWNDDAHFLNAAALAMRHVLVNHAKSRVTAKRGAGALHLPLTAADQHPIDNDEMLVNLDEALVRLAQQSPRVAQIVECRFFAGYDEQATARALALSERTVRRDWALARAWLHRELGLPQGSDALPSG
jgi:RNA polymerase sigma factor (TIGR02999 family)